MDRGQSKKFLDAVPLERLLHREMFMTGHRSRLRRNQVNESGLLGRVLSVMVGLTALAAVVSSSVFGPKLFVPAVLFGAYQPLTVTSLRLEVLRELPHDRTAFTQGLLWRDGFLYESTGQYGNSRVRRLNPRTGSVEHEIFIAPTLFGEGLAMVGNELFMLTYKAERAIVFDADTFDPVRVFRYGGEGWGLCYDGKRLIMSNGSDTLTFRDPVTFEQTGTVRVTFRGQPLTDINELECAKNRVYANIWQDDFLVIIDPSTGRVTHQIDASGLLASQELWGADVLNGVAYDSHADTFYLTGKLWPKMFEVRFVE